MLDRRERFSGRTIAGVPIIGRCEDLITALDEYHVHGVDVDEIWIADKKLSEPELQRLERECESRGVKVSSIESALNLSAVHASAPHIINVGRRVERNQNETYFVFKRIADAFGSSLLLVALAPLAVVVAIATSMDVGLPVIFWQQRIGLHGKRFVLYKFRTYQAPFTKHGQPIEADNRLSKLGQFIRATRFDEIPQLFNILRGDMSLIGPRPLLPDRSA